MQWWIPAPGRSAAIARISVILPVMHMNRSRKACGAFTSIVLMDHLVAL
jgi:hypothetical protein